MPYHKVPVGELAATIERLETEGEPIIGFSVAGQTAHIVTRRMTTARPRPVPTVSGGPA